MKKIVDIMQSIFGLLAVFSFFAIFVILFSSKVGLSIDQDYILVFFSLIFISLPISIFLNKFTRNKKFTTGYYIFLLILLSMGLVGLYFTVKAFQTYTVYTLSLEDKGANIFEGSFNVPQNIILDNGKYTFYVDFVYTLSLGAIGNKWLNVESSNPGGSFHNEINVSSDDKKSTNILRYSSQYNFQGGPGDYSFKVYPEEGSGSALFIKSIKIQIRKYR